jgi:hypothetical protein
LNNRARICGIVLASVGLLAVPIGTVISGYILYLLACKKGRFICSPDYHAIVQATPHVKYRTSPVAWALLAVAVLAAFVIAAALVIH